jgi:hypothetical protein
MNKIIEKIEWIFDYHIAYFLYNPNKIDRYYQYLNERWIFSDESANEGDCMKPIVKEDAEKEAI